MISFFLDFTTSFCNSQITYWVFLAVSFMTLIVHVFKLELISFLLNLLPLLSKAPYDWYCIAAFQLAHNLGPFQLSIVHQLSSLSSQREGLGI